MYQKNVKAQLYGTSINYDVVATPLKKVKTIFYKNNAKPPILP